MDPTDLADVTGYAFLVNGHGPADNWTGQFEPGERVRLRIINGSAMSFFDVRIPDLPMTVVAADGQLVAPVEVDEFRFGVGETYDVIVRPTTDQAYTIFAEPLDRSGYARATLATRPGMAAEIPPLRPRATLTMADMPAGHGGMDHGTMAAAQPVAPTAAIAHGTMDHSAMDHGAMDHGGHDARAMGRGPVGAVVGTPMAGTEHGGHGAAMADMEHAAPGTAGRASAATMDHGSMAGHESVPARPAQGEPRAVGWDDAGTLPGMTALRYEQLRSLAPNKDRREPNHEIVARLTGVMDRYIWTLNGEKFGDGEPIRVDYGERVRIRFINETMMAHPMHLHGMFLELDNGQAGHLPLKHVVVVPPGRTVSALLTADEPGEWPFHCHLLYHMAAGMMTRFIVAAPHAGAHG